MNSLKRQHIYGKPVTRKGGYTTNIILGIPGQDFGEVEDTVKFAHKCDVKISISEYLPLAYSKDFEKAKKQYPCDEHLLHINSFYKFLDNEINC